MTAISIFLLSTCVTFAQEKTGDAQAIAFFEKHIRPALIEHCYECHSEKAESLEADLRLDSRAGMLRGGESGAPAVVPGKTTEGSLLSSLRYEDLEMPPEHPLPKNVIQRFEEWIEMGAPDPRTGSLHEAIDTKLTEARNFWSFVPLKKKRPVSIPNDDWSNGEIDRYVLRRLRDAGIAPAPPAEKAAFLRRLYIDLIGLPPTPDETKSFVDDHSSNPVEKVVDRLLAMEQFGQRWGRHWLDVARYAETSGGGRSLTFKNAWRFRDYVVDSFNADKPFDQFVTEQIAGDLLTSESDRQRREQITATGFLALGPTNYELQDKELLRVEVIDEQIDTIGKAFLGLTLGCARCHDHKFDPISIRDYYALSGILGSTKSLLFGNVSNFVEVDLPGNTQQAKIDELQIKIDNTKKLQKENKSLLKKAETELAALEKRHGIKPSSGGGEPGIVSKDELEGIVVDDEQATLVGQWKVSTHTKNYVGLGYRHDEQMEKGKRSISFTAKLPESGEYDVRLAFNAASSRASNVPVKINTSSGSVTLTVNQRKTPEESPLFKTIGRFHFEKSKPATVILSNEKTDGYVIADAVQFLPVKNRLVAKKKSAPANQEVIADLLSPEAIQRTKDQQKMEELRKEVVKLKAEDKTFADAVKKDSATQSSLAEKAMVVVEEEKPGDERLLISGVIRKFGPVIPRKIPKVFAAGQTVAFNDKESGRRELANWLVSEENPLTSRVIVNRVWLHLLGNGIVRTPDDFGISGDRPTHPELLDALAIDFMNDDWSIKRLVRRIVLSRTYQMGFVKNESAEQIDPENKLLWRHSQRRLDAEVIRDSVLYIGGNLDNSPVGTLFKGTEYGYKFTSLQRSIYEPVLRNNRHDLLSAFDFPNPNLVSGVRNSSTVSPQALFMMNSPFVASESLSAAKRLMQIAEVDDQERINYVYSQVLGRTPTAGETALTLEFLDHSAQNEAETWAQVYQVLFASVDFRFAK